MHVIHAIQRQPQLAHTAEHSNTWSPEYSKWEESMHLHTVSVTKVSHSLLQTLWNLRQLVSHARPPLWEESGVIAYADLCPRRDPVLTNQIHCLLYDISLKLRDIASARSKDMVTRTSRTSKTMWTWALLTSLTALPHGRHCARDNYAIITFLWYKSAYTILPDPSAGGLAHETIAPVWTVLMTTNTTQTQPLGSTLVTLLYPQAQ